MSSSSELIALTGVLVTPAIGVFVWIWTLSTRVAVLDTRFDDITSRLMRIEHLLDSLVKLNGR